jgi:hypothetical protein
MPHRYSEPLKPTKDGADAENATPLPTPLGLTIKRQLLERVVHDDPAPDVFEEWLLGCASALENAAACGAVAAMARDIFDEWRMVHSSANFRQWLERGAASEDAFEGRGKSGAR